MVRDWKKEVITEFRARECIWDSLETWETQEPSETHPEPSTSQEPQGFLHICSCILHMTQHTCSSGAHHWLTQCPQDGNLVDPTHSHASLVTMNLLRETSGQVSDSSAVSWCLELEGRVTCSAVEESPRQGVTGISNNIKLICSPEKYCQIQTKLYQI